MLSLETPRETELNKNQVKESKIFLTFLIGTCKKLNAEISIGERFMIIDSFKNCA